MNDSEYKSKDALAMDDTRDLVDDDTGDAKLRKRQLLLKLSVICIVWVFTFTAYSGLQNLESSLNPGVGVYSLAALTGGGLISCLLAPAVISFIGAKWSLASSWICLAIFVAANFYPKAYVLIPSAAIEGLSTGLMWTAQGSYVTTIAMEYSPLVGEPFESVLSRFFGLFCMAFQSTQIWGNLISSAILGTGVKGNATTDNFTVPAFCGANDCPFDQAPGNATEAQQPENTADRILIGLYLGFVAVGFIITVVFLKPLKSSTSNQPVSLARLLGATVRLLFTNLNMSLLVPFSLYTGLEQVVMYAEFTKSYVACELGIHWVGYTLISFGVLNTIGSPLSGVMGKYIGRPALFLIATILNLGVLAALRLIILTRNEIVLFFALPGVWGLGDAIWQTQSAALIGSTFADQQEPAFSNLRMFQALGFTIGYLYSNFLCESIKLYIVAAVLVLSMTLVTIVEIRIRRNVDTSTSKSLVI